MKWFFSHKMESTIIALSLLLFLFGSIFIKIFFFSSGNNDYGTRLDGIEKVRINQDKIEKIRLDLEKESFITKVDGYIKGKIVNFIVIVKNDADLNETREKADHILENFNSKEKDFYDVQVYITVNEKKDGYPSIGYKGKNSSDFIWLDS